jgi:membrane protein implicated in regulation of membrane protease activity
MDYGVDATGHASVSAHAPHAAEFHFPFFSPLALATLFACIGGYGLIALYGFHLNDTSSILVALPAAVVTAYGVTYAGFRIVGSSRGSSQIRLQDLAGADAEVITPIPKGGLGEVAALVGGQRYTAPAREAQGREVPRGAHVKVVKMVGTTLVVESH